MDLLCEMKDVLRKSPARVLEVHDEGDRVPLSSEHTQAH